MRIHRFTTKDAPILNRFVEKHPFGGIEQSWEWGVLQSKVPGRSAFYALGVFDGEELLGSILVIRQSLGMKKSWLWAPRGPLLPEAQAEAVWGVLAGELKRIAAEHGDVFLRIEPGVPVGEGFVPQGRVSKEHYLPGNTLMLDLSLSEQQLLAQMKQKGRYNIKLAHKNGVVVRRADESFSLNSFYDVLEETGKRDGFKVHGIDFYQNFLGVLGDKAHLYLAYYEHHLIGGMLVTTFGDRATYYFGASANTHRDHMAPYALQWFAIQHAKAHGFKEYDFLGIAPEGDGKHALKGVTQFKTRFGGQRVDYHPAQVFVYKPLWWRLYRALKCVRPFLPF